MACGAQRPQSLLCPIERGCMPRYAAAALLRNVCSLIASKGGAVSEDGKTGSSMLPSRPKLPEEAGEHVRQKVLNTAATRLHYVYKVQWHCRRCVARLCLALGGIPLWLVCFCRTRRASPSSNAESKQQVRRKSHRMSRARESLSTFRECCLGFVFSHTTCLWTSVHVHELLEPPTHPPTSRPAAEAWNHPPTPPTSRPG